MSSWAKAGDRVRLEGLKKAAVHNGKEAVVQGSSLQRGSSGHDRFVIRTSSGTELAVKPVNMRHLAEAETPQQEDGPSASTLALQQQVPATLPLKTNDSETKEGVLPQTTSYRTRSGAVISSTLEFLVESKLSRYTDQVSIVLALARTKTR